MAKNFLTGIKLLNLTSDPEIGTEGELYFNTIDNAIKLYSNGQWRYLHSSLSAGYLTDINSISTPQFIEFDTSFSPSASLPTGSLYWHEEHQTLHLSLANEVSLDIGQEEHYPPVVNTSGVQINRGELVMVTGVQGDKLAIAKAVTDGSVDFNYIIGIAAHDILDNDDEASIIKFGYLNPINTNSYAVGTILYPNPTVSGGLTDVQPDAPGYRIPIAIVTKQGTAGKILVRMQPPSKLGDTDSNVKFSGLENEDLLIYNSASSLWVNEPIQNYLNTASAAAYASASAYTDSEISSLTTTDIEEGSNLYFTETRSLNTASTALVHNNHTNITATFDSDEIRLSATAGTSFLSGSAVPTASASFGTVFYRTDEEGTKIINFYVYLEGEWLSFTGIEFWKDLTGVNWGNIVPA